MIEDSNTWINVTRSYHKCPYCEQGVLDNRIKRGFFIRNFLFWINLKRYECNTCERKVYIRVIRNNSIA